MFSAESEKNIRKSLALDANKLEKSNNFNPT